MKKIFFDANIFIDLANSSNEMHKAVVVLLNKIDRKNKQLYCSPTTFAITYYFLSKIIRDRNNLNKRMIEMFSSFNFTREDNLIMEKVMKSAFTDLEDALQYYSALDSKVDVIITKNYFDYSKSVIPVYHPLQYISEFLL